MLVRQHVTQLLRGPRYYFHFVFVKIFFRVIPSGDINTVSEDILSNVATASPNVGDGTSVTGNSVVYFFQQVSSYRTEVSRSGFLGRSVSQAEDLPP